MPWVCLQFVIVVFPDHTHLHCDYKITVWVRIQTSSEENSIKLFSYCRRFIDSYICMSFGYKSTCPFQQRHSLQFYLQHTCILVLFHFHGLGYVYIFERNYFLTYYLKDVFLVLKNRFL